MEYIGTELDLFSRAQNWKTYLRRQIRPFLGARVLEVGAGIGSTTRVFCDGLSSRWICLEPDPKLAARLEEAILRGTLPACCEVVVGSLGDISPGSFDTILYIDVLEHIAGDRHELQQAAGRLAPDGSMVVLCPAHQWLYSPFDRSVGHVRRYSKLSLSQLTPPGLRLVRLRYLDSIGLLASIGNSILLKQSMPSMRQVLIWDRLLVPLSRGVDRALCYSVGKSVLAVWKKVERDLPQER